MLENGVFRYIWGYVISENPDVIGWFWFRCDRDRKLRRGKEGTLRRCKQSKSVIVITRFIRTYNSLAQHREAQSNRRTPLGAYSQKHRSRFLATLWPRFHWLLGRRKPATGRDRRACRAGFPRIPVTGLCPHGALVLLRYTGFGFYVKNYSETTHSFSTTKPCRPV